MTIICKKYKDKLKEIIDKYEKKFRDLKYVNSTTENKELTHENKNIINEKEKDTLYIKDIQFINNKCNKCQTKSDTNIFQCISCENYYLCQDCYNENNDKTLCFHKHKFLYFFEIIFPKELIKKINQKRKDDKKYNEVIEKFNDILNKIFFDKDGNFSNKKYNMDLSHIEKLKSLFDDMNKINEDPFKYFEDYKKFYINPDLEKIEKEGKQKEIILLIKEKIEIFMINLSSYAQKK